MKTVSWLHSTVGSLMIGLLSSGLLTVGVPEARSEGLDHWTLRNPRLTANVLRSVAFGNGTFVAVGDAGTIMTSTNGADWAVRPLDPLLSFRAICHGNGRFVALADILASTNGNTQALLTSLDGTNWISRNDGPSYLADVAFGNGLFAAVGPGGTITYSPDALIWSNRTVSLPGSINALTFGNGLFVAVGYSLAHVSSNLISWTTLSLPGPPFNGYGDVTYGNNQFVVVGGSGSIATSSNGTNWFSRSSGVGADLGAATFGNGRFVAFARYGGGGLVLNSTNGTNWDFQPIQSLSTLNGAAFGNGTFVAVGDLGTVLTSINPSLPDSWTNRASITSYSFYGVAYGNGSFVAVGDYGTVATSVGGTVWAIQDSGTNSQFSDVAFGGGKFVAASTDGILIRSTNGTNWSDVFAVPNTAFQGIAYGGGLFVAVGIGFDPLSGERFGAAFTSPDGANWTRRTVPSRSPLQKIVYGNGRFLASMEPGFDGSTAVLTSSDGVTWECHFLRNNITLTVVAFGQGQFVAIGNDDEIGSPLVAASVDGEHWFLSAAGAPQTIPLAMGYGGGNFVLAGYGISTTSSGLFWTNRSVAVAESTESHSIAYGNGTFVTVGYNGIILQSDPVSDAAGQAPVIVQQPQSLVVGAGSSAGFGVGVTGSAPLGHQWRRNGAPIAGATNALLLLENVGASQSGVYSVTVSNSLGGAVSAPAALTVVQPDPLDYWHLRPSGLSVDFDASLYGVAFGNGQFVAVGNGSLIVSSADGVNWFRRLPPFPFQGRNLTYGAGLFLAIEDPEEFDEFICRTELVSGNGVTWTNGISLIGTPPHPFCLPSLRSVAYGGGKFVAVGPNSILVSSNGADWRYAVNGVELGLNAVAYGNGIFVAVGHGEFDDRIVLISSTDGYGWTYGTHDAFDGAGGGVGHVAFGNGLFVATGLYEQVLTSSDGLLWEASPLPFMLQFGAIAFGGGSFAAVPSPDSGFSGSVFTSEDGLAWFSHYVPDLDVFGAQFRAMTYGRNTFVAVGEGGAILQSDPLSNSPPSIVRQLRGVTVREGNQASLTAGVIGSSPLWYEWYKNGSLLCLSGRPELFFENVQLSDAGNYQVIVRNRFGQATSAVVRVTVEREQPVLLIQNIGAARLTILGSTGASYQIQCTDDLGAGEAGWRALATIDTFGGPVTWIDPESPIVSMRFYRLVQE